MTSHPPADTIAREAIAANVVQLLAEPVGSNAWKCARALAQAIADSIVGAPPLPTPADVDGFASLMLSFLNPKTELQVTTGLTKAFPNATIGPLGAVVLPGGGGGGDPEAGDIGAVGSYSGDGTDGRVIPTGLASISRLIICNSGQFNYSDGTTSLDGIGFAGVWEAAALIPFSGGGFTVNASLDGWNTAFNPDAYFWVAWIK